MNKGLIFSSSFQHYIKVTIHIHWQQVIKKSWWLSLYFVVKVNVITSLYLCWVCIFTGERTQIVKWLFQANTAFSQMHAFNSDVRLLFIHTSLTAHFGLCIHDLLTECCSVVPLSQAFSSSITELSSPALLTVNSSLWLCVAPLKAWLSTDTWPLPEKQRHQRWGKTKLRWQETWSEQ